MEVWLTIVICFCILYPIVPKKHIGWLLFAFVLAFAVMAFHCVPKETDDLYRYFQHLEMFRKTDWEGLQWHIKNRTDAIWDGLPVCAYYFYFVSKLGHNGFLPAITIFLCYSSMMLVIYKASVKFEVGKWYMFWGCLFAISTFWFYDVCSGTRNGLAFCIFILCTYYDLAEKKYRPLCYIGYFLCAGLHSSTIVIIMVRLVIFILDKYESRLIYWTTIFSVGIGGSVLQWIGEHSSNPYLQKLSTKAESHIERMGYTYSSQGDVQFFVNIVVVIVVIALSIYLFRYLKGSEKFKGFESFSKFYKLLIFFTVASVLTGLIFVRLARWVIPILGGMMYAIGMQCFKNHILEEEGKVKRKSVIRQRANILNTNVLIINLLFIAFTVIHIWYACNGTSLLWLLFEPV